MSVRALSIRSKLIGAFSILTALVLTLGIISLSGLDHVHGHMQMIGGKWLPSARKAGEIDAITGRYNTSLLKHVLTINTKDIIIVENDVLQRAKNLDNTSTAYEPLITSVEERKLYESFRRDWHAFVNIGDQIMSLSRQGEKTRALALYEAEAVQPRRRASLALEALIKRNNESAAAAETAATESSQRTRVQVLAAIGTAVLLSIGLAWLIVQGISRGISSVVRPMQALASGDLTGLSQKFWPEKIVLPGELARDPMGRSQCR